MKNSNTVQKNGNNGNNEVQKKLSVNLDSVGAGVVGAGVGAITTYTVGTMMYDINPVPEEAEKNEALLKHGANVAVAGCCGVVAGKTAATLTRRFLNGVRGFGQAFCADTNNGNNGSVANTVADIENRAANRK